MTQSTDSRFTLHQGNNIDVLRDYPDNHFDSVVTDPPYGIDFLGKDWDSHTGSIDTYKECLRVLKPGGHLLAFSAARTYHHLAMSVELAGFEIRDQIMWVYSSGFPKSQDVGKSIDRSLKKGKFVKTGKTRVSGGPKENPNGPLPRSEETIHIPESDQAKQWSGWGTALKPAHEPIVVARKPAKVSIAKNVQIYGTGALNIDACRVAYAADEDPADFDPANNLRDTQDNALYKGGWGGKSNKPAASSMSTTAHANYNSEKNVEEGLTPGEKTEWIPSDGGRFPSNVLGELGEYQKFFYCPKVSRKERHAGFEDPGPLFSGMSKAEVVMGGMLNSSDKNKTNTRGDVEKQSNIPKPITGHIKGCYDENGQRFAEGKTKKKHDPLGHIPTDPSGMLDRTHGSGNANENIENKGIPTEQSMLDDMGGYYCDNNGERQTMSGKIVRLPHLSGTQQIHGLKEHYADWCKANGKVVNSANNHPTVKPQKLMEYLIRLVTPPGSKVLDPFNGSGSTGMAAVKLGHHYTGIDLDEKYIEISSKRITAWNQPEEETNNFQALFDETTK